MPKFKNLTGLRFGKLTVLKRLDRRGNTYYWECKCDCGNTKEIPMTSLTKGTTNSCGCLVAEKNRERSTTHGMSKTRIFNIWKNMLDRCSNPNNISHKSYYDKGITVCDKWKRFEGFYEDMKNGYNDELSLDRIDGNKGYSKDNCRWATVIEQANNTRSNVYVTLDGIKDTLPNMCRRLGVSYNIVRNRVQLGWDIDKALKTPKLDKNRNLKYNH